MKRLAFATLLVGLAVWQVAGQAQAPSGVGSWYTATTYSVKPGMMEEFRRSSPRN